MSTGSGLRTSPAGAPARRGKSARDRASLRRITMLQPLGLQLDPGPGHLWEALSALLERVTPLAGRDTLADDFLDALVEVMAADRGLLLLVPARGEPVAVNARGGQRALSPQERAELSRTLIAQVEREGRAAVVSALDGLDASESLQELGVVAAIAAPLEARALSPGPGGEGFVRGVLYVDFRAREKLVGPAHGQFVELAAKLLSSLLEPGQRLQRVSEELRAARLRERPEEPELPLSALLAGPSLEAVRREVESCLGSDGPILVTGESGTGKTLLARAIALASGRTPIVRAMLPGADAPGSLASELFGHEAGAFPGALARRVGLVEHADGGTLIFDEILNLPPTAQQLLLDFTQFGTYRPLGWSHRDPRHARVRLIAATNGDLPRALEEGRFRRDLFHRLAEATLRLPPLRERREEVALLAIAWLDRLDPARRWRLSPELAQLLGSEKLSWPGNLRQLGAVVRRARDRAITRDRDADELDLPHVEPRDLGLDAALPAAGPPVTSREPVDAALAQLQARRAELDTKEAELIRAALGRSGGVVSRAARSLGVPRTSLLSRMATLGIERPDEP